jgi:hypothetical protein
VFSMRNETIRDLHTLLNKDLYWFDRDITEGWQGSGSSSEQKPDITCVFRDKQGIVDDFHLQHPRCIQGVWGCQCREVFRVWANATGQVQKHSVNESIVL